MKGISFSKHTQATPRLVDVDELLAKAARAGWPDMCRMLIVDGHAGARTVVKMSSSSRLQLREHCLKDRPHEILRGPDEEVLEAVYLQHLYDIARLWQQLLAEGTRAGWPDMCRMLIVDGHAGARTVVKMSSSSRLQLREHCLKDRPHEALRGPDEEVLGALTACLSEEVFEAMTAAQETGNE